MTCDGYVQTSAVQVFLAVINLILCTQRMPCENSVKTCIGSILAVSILVLEVCLYCVVPAHQPPCLLLNALFLHCLCCVRDNYASTQCAQPFSSPIDLPFTILQLISSALQHYPTPQRVSHAWAAVYMLGNSQC